MEIKENDYIVAARKNKICQKQEPEMEKWSEPKAWS